MKTKRKGITLIEVIISLALLGLIVVGVFPLFTTTMKINQTNREKQKIHEEILTEMENFRSKTYKEIITGNQLETTINKGTYEIKTKIEFEQDPQISTNQSYGYLKMNIYAQNKETNEIIDQVKTYISNNGDDTTILIRVRDEWSEENGNIDWIENIETELNNEYNGSKETKTTDPLGKTIYFNPPVGNYKANILAANYRESALSPNPENTTFIAKKGCTTYQEYWLYKPININVYYENGTNNMDVRLKTSQNDTLIDKTFAPNYLETAYEARPLGRGNQSHYTIEAGFGTTSGAGMVWIEDEYLYDEWNGQKNRYDIWVARYIDHTSNRSIRNYWKTANWQYQVGEETRYTRGQFRIENRNYIYGISYLERYADNSFSRWKWIRGEWVANPNTSSQYSHVYRYLIKPRHQEYQEGIYQPDYTGNIYYKNADKQWTQLRPKEIRLQKTPEGKFVFENGSINTVTGKSELKLIVKAQTDTAPVNEATDSTITLAITE